MGELLESALGACSQSRPVPDFEHLGIEMKTIPIHKNGRPRESTHVCTVRLRDLVGQRWRTSTVYAKLQRVLWIPIEAAPSIPLARRRVGCPIIWSPTANQERVLRDDWEEQVELIATGRIDELDARLGTYLQVRPKAANAQALAPATDASGAPAHHATSRVLSAAHVHAFDPQRIVREVTACCPPIGIWVTAGV